MRLGRTIGVERHASLAPFGEKAHDQLRLCQPRRRTTGHDEGAAGELEDRARHDGRGIDGRCPRPQGGSGPGDAPEAAAYTRKRASNAGIGDPGGALCVPDVDARSPEHD